VPFSPECVCTTNVNNGLRYSTHLNCSGHDDQFVKFPTEVGSKGQYSDNLCGLTFNDMLTFRGDVNQDWLNTSMLTSVLNANVSGSPAFPGLYSILKGSNPQPPETVILDLIGNGDFHYYWLGPDENIYAKENHYAPADTRNIYLLDRISPWTHYGWKPSQITHYAQVNDPVQYAQGYPGKPIPQRTSKLLKVTMTVGAVATSYFDNNTSTIKFLTLSDYHFPPSRSNNAWKCSYTLYFPYDSAAPGNVTNTQIAALNRPETQFSQARWTVANSRFTYRKVRNPLTGTYKEYKEAYIGPQGYNVIDSIKWFYTSAAEVVNRPRVNGCVFAVARKRNAEQYPNAPTPNFPTNATIEEGTIKVVRSGRRNLLNETIEELSQTATSADLAANNLRQQFSTAYNNVLNAASTTYTDQAAAAESNAIPTTAYYNPYVNGMSGVYRILSKYNVKLNRSYLASLDHQNGLLNGVPSFWKRVNSQSDKRYYNMLEPGASAKWYQEMTVGSYSPWGGDLEVADAAGNRQSTLYGYGGTVPVANVRNSEWNNSLYESFEDVTDSMKFLNFFQNPLRAAVRTGHPRMFRSKAAKHTGEWGLGIIQQGIGVRVPIQPAVPATFPARAVSPFFFRPGKKYILSFWQSAAQNTANLSAPGMVSVEINGNVQSVYAKSPVIDGWVLYEGEISIPSFPASAFPVNSYLNLAPGTVDDIRILPAEANMKCYVYYPTNRKLAAVLDENHMSSLFEYDAEGKLVRVKKETEKGILTLNESRSSVHTIWTGSPVNLKN